MTRKGNNLKASYWKNTVPATELPTRALGQINELGDRIEKEFHGIDRVASLGLPAE